MGLFFSHWDECSICGEIHNCECTHEQKQAYEKQAELVREAANVKRQNFGQLLRQVRGDDKVITFDAEIEQTYDHASTFEDNWAERPSFAQRVNNPTHNLELDLTGINAKVRVKPERVEPILRPVTSLEDVQEAFPGMKVERVNLNDNQ